MDVVKSCEYRVHRNVADRLNDSNVLRPDDEHTGAAMKFSLNSHFPKQGTLAGGCRWWDRTGCSAYSDETISDKLV